MASVQRLLIHVVSKNIKAAMLNQLQDLCMPLHSKANKQHLYPQKKTFKPQKQNLSFVGIAEVDSGVMIQIKIPVQVKTAKRNKNYDMQKRKVALGISAVYGQPPLNVQIHFILPADMTKLNSHCEMAGSCVAAAEPLLRDMGDSRQVWTLAYV